VILTSLAGYVGLVAGIGLLELINGMLEKGGGDTGMFYHPGVDMAIALKALLILVVSGALAGVVPARKAVSISPVDALRAD
jgi:putative ABC transport system permease protein